MLDVEQLGELQPADRGIVQWMRAGDDDARFISAGSRVGGVRQLRWAANDPAIEEVDRGRGMEVRGYGLRCAGGDGIEVKEVQRRRLLTLGGLRRGLDAAGYGKSVAGRHDGENVVCLFDDGGVVGEELNGGGASALVRVLTESGV